MHTKFWSENLKERDHVDDLCVSGGDNSRMGLKEIRWEGVNWIHLAQVRDWWQALVNLVMNLWVP